jgi:hypothetical protein
LETIDIGWAQIPFRCIDNPPTLLTLGGHVDTIEAVSPTFQWTFAAIQQLEGMANWYDQELEVRKLFEELMGSDNAGVQHRSFELFLSRFMSNQFMYSVLQFLNRERTVMEGRKLATLTKKDCIVVVSPCTRPGDECVYFADFRPFVVRNTPKQQPHHSNELILSAMNSLCMNYGPNRTWEARTPSIEYRRLIGACCFLRKDHLASVELREIWRFFDSNWGSLSAFGIY